MRKGESGFTLVETLVVVSIIGVLSAIAIPQYANYKQQALDSDARSCLHHLATALEGYYVATNDYTAATIPDLEASYGFRPSSGVTATITTADTTHYIVTASAAGGSGTFTLDSTTGSMTGP